MNKKFFFLLFFNISLSCLLTFVGCSTSGEEPSAKQAIKAMKKATQYFRKDVATNGGYLWRYKTDFTLRQGEEVASPSTIWVQPPGTPSIGMAFLEAYKVTGDTMFLNVAISTARALAWGQLASGGWDYRIDFDPAEGKKWYYRRDIESGDTIPNRRRNRSSLDDDNTQSALQFLMQLDKVLDFKDSEIHHTTIYGLDALIKVQYPNGAWSQSFITPPDPAKYPVKKAQYPKTWSREYPGISYGNYYTFNDNSMADDIKTMIGAYKIYGDEGYLNSAKKCGDFMILAQMPDPQPAWAQQYNPDMEPAWARKFEPPSITGGETFGIIRTLLDLYLETGEQRFLEPVPKALNWAENSLLPDKRIARFYELKTNKPLYFNAPRQYSNLPAPAFPDLKDYTLIYEDTDLPNHYSFKGSSEPIAGLRTYYDRLLKENRDSILAERNRIPQVDPAQVYEIITSLDKQGRWVEKGRLKTTDQQNPYVEAEVISTGTFIRNMTLLTNYLRNKKD